MAWKMSDLLGKDPWSLLISLLATTSLMFGLCNVHNLRTDTHLSDVSFTLWLYLDQVILGNCSILVLWVFFFEPGPPDIGVCWSSDNICITELLFSTIVLVPIIRPHRFCPNPNLPESLGCWTRFEINQTRKTRKNSGLNRSGLGWRNKWTAWKLKWACFYDGSVKWAWFWGLVCEK